MKIVWTSGKRIKAKNKLSHIPINCERGELILVSSLTDLKRRENLEKFKYLFSHDFTDKVGKFGDSHLFNALPTGEFKKKIIRYGNGKPKVMSDREFLSRIETDKKINYLERSHPTDLRYNYIYCFDNDQDGLSPNIHKVRRKSEKNEISFFVNPSNISTADFIDEAVHYLGIAPPSRSSDRKIFQIMNNDLVFCCIPETNNKFCKTQFKKSEIKSFNSNMNLFIKNRIEKKKLIKFKVPNGIYGIYSITKRMDWEFKNIPMEIGRGELLGHYISRFNPKLKPAEIKKKFDKRGKFNY